LTEVSSGDSGTASESSNIGPTVDSFFGRMFGSVAGPAVSEHCAALCASIWGAVAGTAK